MIPREASALTRERPDIWLRGLALATSITGMRYPHKAPLPDGALYACGHYPVKMPPVKMPTKTVEEIRKEKKTEIDEEIREREEEIKNRRGRIVILEEEIREHGRQIEILKKEKTMLAMVPIGAMEWLLHEIGHFVVADAAERLRPNYGLSEKTFGHDGDREIEAWAFAEIVMAPFGPARGFAPPTQRDGAAFDASGPIAQRHFARAERQIAAAGVSIDHMRLVWGDWVKWGAARGVGRAPWETEN